jgi:hypothetical protein
MLRPFWFAVLIAASAVLTTWYTCITPFAAFAVIAATTLTRRHAIVLTIAVWLANQAVGFGALNYPWTPKTFAWGIAIGGAAVLGVLAAQWTLGRLGSLRAPVPVIGGFAAAFALYQSALYAVAATLLGGTGAFAPAIVGHVLVINAIRFVGLLGLGQLVQAIGTLARRRRAQAAAARFA